MTNKIKERIETLRNEVNLNECARNFAMQSFEKEHNRYHFTNYLHYHDMVEHLQKEIEFLKSLIEGE